MIRTPARFNARRPSPRRPGTSGPISPFIEALRGMRQRGGGALLPHCLPVRGGLRLLPATPPPGSLGLGWHPGEDPCPPRGSVAGHQRGVLRLLPGSSSRAALTPPQGRTRGLTHGDLGAPAPLSRGSAHRGHAVSSFCLVSGGSVPWGARLDSRSDLDGAGRPAQIWDSVPHVCGLGGLNRLFQL